MPTTSSNQSHQWLSNDRTSENTRSSPEFDVDLLPEHFFSFEVTMQKQIQCQIQVFEVKSDFIFD